MDSEDFFYLYEIPKKEYFKINKHKNKHFKLIYITQSNDYFIIRTLTLVTIIVLII